MVLMEMFEVGSQGNPRVDLLHFGFQIIEKGGRVNERVQLVLISFVDRIVLYQK